VTEEPADGGAHDMENAQSRGLPRSIFRRVLIVDRRGHD
jgi:hypothetical protein